MNPWLTSVVVGLLIGMATATVYALWTTPRALRGPDPLDRREEKASQQGLTPQEVRRG